MTVTDIDAPEGEEGAVEKGPAFGTLSVPDNTESVSADRTKFRIAILGDFSGRASRGVLETGEALGARKPMKLDVDTIDDVIARFRTQLVLPIGPGGASVEVELGSLDDLHPDELYDNVEVFAELQNLRRMLKGGRAEQAMENLKSWGDEFGHLKALARKRARGTEVPADMKLTDFQKLLEANPDAQPEATPADELIRRIIGPYVVKAEDPAIEGMVSAADEALSGAMRALLHHPDFQAVESVWRSLDLLARRVETGGGLELVIYDVAAEEIAADLAAHDELTESGLFTMLAEKPGLDAGQGRLAALIGLYQFEETPPHAELLGRMAKIAAYIDAPFVASISAKLVETKTEDVHHLTKEAWDALKALPEASYLGLAAPRFLLRQPYGKRSDPIDPFDFEEFTQREGLKGMLWTNPAVLVAVLLGASWTQTGGKVTLGGVMTLDDIPFHYMTDSYGDQIALPCTERLLTEKTVAITAERGVMPVLSIQGRNEVRLGSWRSVAGGELAGPWKSGGIGGPAAMKKRNDAAVAAVAAASAAAAPPPIPGGEDDDVDQVMADLEADDAEQAEADDDGGTEDLDALLADLDTPDEDADDEGGLDDLDALLADLDDDAGGDDADDGGDDDLDALLAEFGDDDEASEDDGDMDADLEALLKDL
ncbi:MAG: type VI secretion system contractile sheath large subunit [Pseudomonadota bacterium]